MIFDRRAEDSIRDNWRPIEILKQGETGSGYRENPSRENKQTQLL